MTQYPALAQVFWRPLTLWRDAVVVLVGSWLVALVAQMSIPLEPVPITGQTFGVLLVGAALGFRRGALALGAYLVQGAIGLPFFAGGASGIARLFGPTGGYLIGFVFAAALVGALAERSWDRRFLSTLAAMALGNLVIYLFGLPWLAWFVGWEKVAALGLIPFLPGDALKMLLAAITLPALWAWVGKRAER